MELVVDEHGKLATQCESVNLASGHHVALLFFFQKSSNLKIQKNQKKYRGVDNNW
jgi:hypothetical protein